jgi:hypothetical protein
MFYQAIERFFFFLCSYVVVRFPHVSQSTTAELCPHCRQLSVLSYITSSLLTAAQNAKGIGIICATTFHIAVFSEDNIFIVSDQQRIRY